MAPSPSRRLNEEKKEESKLGLRTKRDTELCVEDTYVPLIARKFGSGIKFCCLAGQLRDHQI